MSCAVFVPGVIPIRLPAGAEFPVPLRRGGPLDLTENVCIELHTQEIEGRSRKLDASYKRQETFQFFSS